MPKTSDKKQNFAYFYAYLSMQIDEGVKQKEIADYIKKPAPYVNKIYLGNQKSCPLDIQRKIADYFGVSYDELISKGRDIFLERNKEDTKEIDVEFTERRSLEPGNLIDQLNTIAMGIRKCGNRLNALENVEEELFELKDTLEIYNIIFSELNEGVSFFNQKRDLIFSSNRWGLLDNFDISKNPNIDSMLLYLRNYIINFDELIQKLDKCYKNITPATINVSLKNNQKFNFRVIPLFKKNKKHIGWLLINTPEI